jgi:3-methyl-2-oxobutanoate hydroxymethyltransferase
MRSDARFLEEAGASAMVLELVPAPLAAEVSRSVAIPTIGIGAGPGCDGQVLVLHDMLGLNEDFAPKFLKKYAKLADTVRDSARCFAEEVRAGRYPGRHSTNRTA